MTRAHLYTRAAAIRLLASCNPRGAIEENAMDAERKRIPTRDGPMDRAAEEALLRQWEPRVRQLAFRFERVAEREDLEQIARCALWQAARRFDPTRGCQFTTYAFRTIQGALLRYLRDRALPVKIPRAWWELRPRLRREAEVCAQELGREPTVPELAAHLGVSEEDVAGALGVGDLYHPTSLDEPAEGPEGEGTETLAGRLGAADPLLEAVERRVVVRQAMDGLPKDLREIVEWRYFQGRSQQQVARQLGVSQMQISRLEQRALLRLRRELREAWGLGIEFSDGARRASDSLLPEEEGPAPRSVVARRREDGRKTGKVLATR
jgi:RNA polymerase sigma-B factor